MFGLPLRAVCGVYATAPVLLAFIGWGVLALLAIAVIVRELRKVSLRCPEHGRYCMGAECCCADLHWKPLAAWRMRTN